MSNKVQVIGKGFCRGDEWTERETFNKAELLELMEKSVSMNDDEFDDFMCSIEDDYDYDKALMISSVITNGDFIIDDTTRTERTKKNMARIKMNESFIIELEEHTFAFGPTKKAAMIEYAKYALGNEDEDTDW